jgi:hypothetical protein
MAAMRAVAVTDPTLGIFTKSLARFFLARRLLDNSIAFVDPRIQLLEFHFQLRQQQVQSGPIAWRRRPSGARAKLRPLGAVPFAD